MAACELQGEDLELFNRLRDKYKPTNPNSGSSVEKMPSDPNAPGAELWQPPAPAPAGQLKIGQKGANVEVRMCPICQGAGMHVEMYQHRRMEKFCTSCSGRGVTVWRDGVEVVEGEGQDTQPLADNARTPGSEDQQQQPAAQHPITATMEEEEANQLQAEIEALDARDKAYTREKLQAETDLEQCGGGGGGDATERQLRGDLVAQLATQIKRVRAVRARKEAQLRLGGRL